jgi:guanyl-specific ribonuclease Sa
MIGGDVFGNREGALPAARGRRYHEADIGYRSGRRNAMRMVWSTDGLVFFTDHYNQWVRVK